MYTLTTQKPEFYRVKRGQTSEDISRVLGCLPPQNIFEGKIIKPVYGDFTVYQADVGDTYSSIAQKFCISAEELKKINGGKPVYPTVKLYIPSK